MLERYIDGRFLVMVIVPATFMIAVAACLHDVTSHVPLHLCVVMLTGLFWSHLGERISAKRPQTCRQFAVRTMIFTVCFFMPLTLAFAYWPFYTTGTPFSLRALSVPLSLGTFPLFRFCIQGNR